MRFYYQEQQCMFWSIISWLMIQLMYPIYPEGEVGGLHVKSNYNRVE